MEIPSLSASLLPLSAPARPSAGSTGSASDGNGGSTRPTTESENNALVPASGRAADLSSPSNSGTLFPRILPMREVSTSLQTGLTHQSRQAVQIYEAVSSFERIGEVELLDRIDVTA